MIPQKPERSRPHVSRLGCLYLTSTLALMLFACSGAQPRLEVFEAQTSASPATPAPSARWEDEPRLSATVDVNAFDEAAARAAIYYATNDERRAHGLSQLKREPLLEISSQIHVARMIEHDFIAHDDPYSAKHRTPTDRARLAGIANPYTAENIATRVAIDYESGDPVYSVPNKKGAFSKTPDGPELARLTYVELARKFLEGWMASPGHRKNVLSKDAVSLGVGAQFYWQDNFPAVIGVQNFQFFEPVIASE